MPRSSDVTTYEATRAPVNETRRTLLAYALAVLSTAAVILFRLGLESVLDGHAPLLASVLAVVATATYGGLWPGLVATVLSAAASAYFLMPPHSSLSVSFLPYQVQLLLFAGVGVWISLLSSQMRSALARSRADAGALGRSEAALRRSEETARRQLAELESIYAAAPIGLCVIDTDLRWVRINEQLAEMNGYPAAAHVGRSVHELLPTLADQTESVLRRILDTGEPVIDIELTGETAARPGEQRVWLESFFPLRDATGRIIGINTVCEEVTEKKRADAALRAAIETAERSRAKLEAIIGNMTEAVLIIDPDRELVTMNPAALALHGYGSMEEACRVLANQFSLWQVMDAGGRPLPEDAWPAARALRGERFTNDEVRVRRLDTDVEFTGSYSGASVRGADGAVTLAVLVIRDVSEDKRTEALRASEAKFRAVFDSDIAPMAFWHIDGRVTEANDAYLRLVGYTREEVARGELRWAELTPPEWRAHDDRALAECAATGRFSAYYKEYLLRDGRRVPILIGGSILLGDPDYGCAFVLDLTELKRTEAALRAASDAAEQSLAQLEAVIASITEGLAIAEPDGTLRAMNQAGLCMYGLTSLQQARVSSRELFDVMTLDGRPVPYEQWPLTRAARGERFAGVELRIRHRDSGQEWIPSYSGGPVLDREGAMIAAVVTFEDITDGKRIERERELLLDSERAARAEAERASRMKDEFLAVLSHELRTPLNAILGWTQLLRTPKRTDAYVDKGLAVIERNTRVQMQLISDLLDVSRIISGKLHLEVEPVALPVVIESAIEACRSMAEAKGITIQDDIELIDVPLLGDPARLQQVITNLLSNAIKFTPKDGSVVIFMVRRSGRAVIAVRDTGHGIPSEFLPHVFERFRQADGSITRSHRGLGLGLSIVKHLVERHGGTVRADSDGPGKGATFTVELPLDDAAIGVTPEPWQRVPASEWLAREPARLEGVRVLVVDDEPDARDMARRVIEERKAVVTAVGSATEALEALAVERPDVIVCDIGMPGMDGYSLVRAIRAGADPRSRSVPALALTAFARPEDRERALQAGFQAHLAKPVEPAELVATVARLAVHA